MSAPTLGRVLLYYPREADVLAGRALRLGEPAPALVVHVWGPTCVNATVFDRNGTPFGATSVVFGGALPEAPEQGHAYWPPRADAPAATTPADPADRGELG